MDDAVTAGGGAAVVQAAVGLDLVSVVAVFGALDAPIAAADRLAAVVASIAFDLVAIVAFFDADVQDGVAADVGATRVRAAVLVDPVAVVAGLFALKDKAVAAAGRCAAIGAGVRVD